MDELRVIGRGNELFIRDFEDNYVEIKSKLSCAKVLVIGGAGLNWKICC